MSRRTQRTRLRQERVAAERERAAAERERAAAERLVPVEVDWRRVAKATLHPAQMTILELMAAEPGRWSPARLHEAAFKDAMSLAGVSYHVRHLWTLGLLRRAGTRPVRGAVEHFYRLA